jgi:hypothetical protein
VSRIGEAAPAFEGVDPADRPVRVRPGEDRLALLFLTTSCEPCMGLWGEARSGDPIMPVVLVTPGPETESRRKTMELAPDGLTVVMSGEAWSLYDVHRAPWLVVVEHDRIVYDERAPATWEEVGALADPLA